MTGRAPILPGLCSVTFRKSPIEEVVELAAKAGLRGIEWGGDVHVPPGQTTLAKRAAAVCHDAGIAVPSYGSYVRAGAEIPKQDFDAVLDTADALGALNVRVWAGRTASQDISEAQRAETTATLRGYAESAAARGITVSIEFHRNTLTDSLASALRLFEEIDQPNCFSYWQPRPGVMADTALTEVEGLVDHLSNIHVFHWNDGERFRSVGQAEDFWTTVLRAGAAARGSSAQRYAFMEFVHGDEVNMFQQDAAVLRRILDQL